MLTFLFLINAVGWAYSAVVRYQGGHPGILEACLIALFAFEIVMLRLKRSKPAPVENEGDA